MQRKMKWFKPQAFWASEYSLVFPSLIHQTWPKSPKHLHALFSVAATKKRN
jgi:hypothetical protein